MTTYVISGSPFTFGAGDIMFAAVASTVGYPITVSPSYVPLTLAHPLYQAGNPAGYPNGTYQLNVWTKIMAGGESNTFTFDISSPVAYWEGYIYSFGTGGGVGWTNPPRYYPGTVLYNSSAHPASATIPNAVAGSTSVLTLGWGVPPSLHEVLTPGTASPIYDTGGPNILTFWAETVPSNGAYQRSGTLSVTYAEASLDLFEFAAPLPQMQMIL